MSPAAVAVTVLPPAMVPNTHYDSVAIPEALVETGVTGRMLPPPPTTANAIDTPATGLPFASVTLTEGGEPAGSPAVPF